MLISEFEAEKLDDFLNMDEKEFEKAGGGENLAGYHDLVDRGRREIYRIES